MFSIYRQQTMTFPITRLNSASTRPVSISIQSSSLLTPRLILPFLDPSSSMICRLSSIEVSEIDLSLASTKYLSFLGRRSKMIWTVLPIDSNWSWLPSSSTEFVFCRSTVGKFSDTVGDRKGSETHLSVSSRKSLPFLDPWSTIFCPFRLTERRIGSPLPKQTGFDENAC